MDRLVLRTLGFIEHSRQGHGDGCSLGIEELPISPLPLLDTGITEYALLGFAFFPSFIYLTCPSQFSLFLRFSVLLCRFFFSFSNSLLLLELFLPPWCAFVISFFLFVPFIN